VKRVFGAAMVTVSFWVAASPAPAPAHVGHGSCKAAGELASTLAQEPTPLGQSFVRPAAHAGDHGVSGVIASAHATLCERTP
jgi:hypothetical protein